METIKKIKISLSNLDANPKKNFLVFKNTLIYAIIRHILCKKIEIVSKANSDLHIFGPYNENIFFNKIVKFTKRKIKKLSLFSFKKKTLEKIDSKPIHIFYSHECRITEKNYDFAFTNHYGMPRETFCRIPFWKELIDWSHIGINREKTNFIKRFGEYYKITDLMKPLGESFLKKKKNICLFTSHLLPPRNSMYEIFSKNFIVDGYGAYFDYSIKNHNSSNFSKKNILSNYAFNLCPENHLYPGCYSEKILESFLGGSLPLGYADHNINLEFNKNAFVNLIDYTHDDYAEICELLKDDNFLKKFANQPLITEEPNLENETQFIKKIIDLI
jgi:hypothetical protein